MRYLLFLSLLVFSCGKPVLVDTSKLPDTYQCNYMKDVCKETEEFEGRYSRMSAEEQEEFKNVLQTYRSQCSDALELCRKSK
ncbi:MAG: hypothetical protein GX556_07645 [Fibrobacter sp.]|nr:hypothetical protein [Fibrobacter sp.]